MMGRLEQLLDNYRGVLRLPFQEGLSGAERVWFAVYPPDLERKLLARLDAFEEATKSGNPPRSWLHISLEDRFGSWMANQEYRESYFARPERGTGLPALFADNLALELTGQIEATSLDQESVVAVSGVASLFGLTRLAALVAKIEDAVPGNLLVFFPGEYVNSQFRLLDARDGWNYHALAITCARGTHEL